MNLELLKEIGLTENESKIYLVLIKNGESTANNLSERIGFHRAYIYDTLSKMINKGVVSCITKSGKKYFKAAHPSKFLEIIKEKESQIKDLIPEILKVYNQKESNYTVETFEGKEAYKTYYGSVMKYLLENKPKEVMSIGSKSRPFDEQLKFFLPGYIKKNLELLKESIKKKKLVLKALYNSSSKNKPFIWKKYQNYRYLPKEIDASKNTMHIIGDNVAIETYSGKRFVTMIRNKDLAKFYRDIFKKLWEISEK